MKAFKSSVAAVFVLSLGIGIAGCDKQQGEDEATSGEFSAVEKSAPVKEARRAIPKEPQVCRTCGTIVGITEVKKKGEASGAGAFMGAIIGGVAGHQVGGGKGKDVATVAGAAAGGYAGHEAEKRYNSTTTFDVTVRMEDGTTRTVNLPEPGGYSVGDKVRVEGSSLTRG